MKGGLPRLGCGAKSHDEQGRQNEIDDAGSEYEGSQAPLKVEDDRRATERKFLERGGNHDETKPHGIARHDEEEHLPREGYADEAVVILGMCDGRWEVATRAAFHEILRKKYENAVDSGNQEDATRGGYTALLALVTRLFLGQRQDATMLPENEARKRRASERHQGAFSASNCLRRLSAFAS